MESCNNVLFASKRFKEYFNIADGMCNGCEVRDIPLYVNDDGSLQRPDTLPDCSTGTIDIIEYNYYRRDCHYSYGCRIDNKEQLSPAEEYHLHQMCSWRKRCLDGLRFPLTPSEQKQRPNAVNVKYTCSGNYQTVFKCSNNTLELLSFNYVSDEYNRDRRLVLCTKQNNQLEGRLSVYWTLLGIKLIRVVKVIKFCWLQVGEESLKSRWGPLKLRLRLTNYFKGIRVCLSFFLKYNFQGCFHFPSLFNVNEMIFVCIHIYRLYYVHFTSRERCNIRVFNFPVFGPSYCQLLGPIMTRLRVFFDLRLNV